jgi:hypothetical protein
VENQDDVVRLARAELASRQFGVTRQFLAVNDVALDPNGSPQVARIDDTSEAGAYDIYFHINDEPYYVVVVVRPDVEGNLAVAGVYMEAAIRGYLGVYSANLSAVGITERVGVVPTKTYARGTPITSHGTILHRRHAWLYEPQAGIPAGFEEKLATLLRLLEPHAAHLAALRPDCTVELAVVYEGWGGDPQFGGLHFEAEATRQISAIGASIDIDLYALGPEMLGDVP